MSAIDLDLVELRCRLRGWECRRMPDGKALGVKRNPHEPETFVGANKFGDMVSVGGPCWEGDFAKPLTRPRLTLADIVASPPEGWRGWQEGTGAWLWENCEHDVRFEWQNCLVQDGPHYGGLLPVDILAAHRAVAELLVLLGEVE